MALISSFYVKEQVFKFRLGTDYSTHPRGPLKYQALFEKLHSFLLGRNKNKTSQESSRKLSLYSGQGYSAHYWGWGKVGFSTVLTWVVKCILCPQNVHPIFFSWYGRNYCQSFPEGTSEKCKLFMQDC